MKYIKILTILLSLALCLTILCNCSSKNPKNNPSTSNIDSTLYSESSITSDSEEDTTLTVTGVDELEAENRLELKDNETATIIKHEMSSDGVTDEIIFKVTSSGTVWDEITEITQYYRINKSGYWSLSDSASSEPSREFHDLSDIWFYSKYETRYQFYKIKDFNEESVTILEIYMDVIGYDNKYGDISDSYSKPEYFSKDYLETKAIVCNKRECTVYIDPEKDSYTFSYNNIEGNYYDITGTFLDIKGLWEYGNYGGTVHLKTTQDISEVTKLALPENVANWIKKH